MKRIFFLALVLVFSFLHVDVNAASSTYEVRTDIQIANEGRAQISQVVTATNVNDEPTPKTVYTPVIGENPEEVKASYGDDANLSATVLDDKQISLATTTNNSGNGDTWEIKLTYLSTLETDVGGSKLFLINPGDYGELEISKESTTINASTDLGMSHIQGPEPSEESADLGNEAFTWISETGPINYSFGLLFGDGAVLNFTAEKTIKNDGWWWKTFEFVLPADTNQQKVVLNSLEPKPGELTLDVDGNMIARYSLRPKQQIVVKAEGQVHIANTDYSQNDGAGIDDVPENLTERYTQTNDTWQAGALGLADVDTNQPAVAITQQVFDGAVGLVNADDSSYDSALELSNKMIGEFRGIGIPARLVLGKSYTDGFTQFNVARNHAWVEAYVPGSGWMTLDAYSYQKDGNMFFSDSQRIGLAMRGLDPNYPPNELDSYNLSWSKSADEIARAATPVLSATNYMILPGISFGAVKIDMGAGTVVDNAAISIDGGETIKLGSLAPLQSTTANSLSIGASAFSSASVSYGFLEGDSIGQSVTDTTMTTNYLPIIGLLLGIGAVLGLIIWLRKRHAAAPESFEPVSNSAVSDVNFDATDPIEEDTYTPAEGIPTLIDDNQPTEPQASEPPSQPEPVQPQKVEAEQPAEVPQKSQDDTMKPTETKKTPKRRDYNPYKRGKKLVQ